MSVSLYLYDCIGVNKTGIEYGFLLSRIRRNEDGESRPGFENKFKIAGEFSLSKNASMVLNTTWNIDQLQRDFPFNECSFKPWDGGNIQIHAQF